MLPPLRMYRQILKAHRAVLQPAERAIGDSYLRHEWQLHKNVTDGVILTKFFKEWMEYLAVLEGRKEMNLGPQLYEKLTDEQLGQLYELRKVIKEQEDAAQAAREASEKK